MINIAFEYDGRKFYITDHHYDNDRLALLIMTADNNEHYTTLTVNLPEQHLARGEFFVKTWSENEEITSHLRDSGIFTDTGKRVSTGFVSAEIWKFKEDEEEELIRVEPLPLHRR